MRPAPGRCFDVKQNGVPLARLRGFKRGCNVGKRVNGLNANRFDSVAPAQPAPAQQPRLGGLDPAERPAPPRGEDDILDIPAFLRRQAN